MESLCFYWERSLDPFGEIYLSLILSIHDTHQTVSDIIQWYKLWLCWAVLNLDGNHKGISRKQRTFSKIWTSKLATRRCLILKVLKETYCCFLPVAWGRQVVVEHLPLAYPSALRTTSFHYCCYQTGSQWLKILSWKYRWQSLAQTSWKGKSWDLPTAMPMVTNVRSTITYLDRNMLSYLLLVSVLSISLEIFLSLDQ
jgi:hypothetical protein